MYDALTTLVELWTRAFSSEQALCTALRVAPLLAFTSALGIPSFPASIRAALLALLSTLGGLGPFAPSAPPLECLGHGVVSALSILVILRAFESCGAIADARNQGPSGSKEGPLRAMHRVFFWGMFASFGGPALLLSALLSPLPRGGEPLAWEAIARLLQLHLDLALMWATPVLLATLLTDLTLGWLQRGLPSLPTWILAAPLRQWLSWVILALLWLRVYPTGVRSLIELINRAGAS